MKQNPCLNAVVKTLFAFLDFSVRFKKNFTEYAILKKCSDVKRKLDRLEVKQAEP